MRAAEIWTQIGTVKAQAYLDVFVQCQEEDIGDFVPFSNIIHERRSVVQRRVPLQSRGQERGDVRRLLGSHRARAHINILSAIATLD